jgi:cytochrome c
MNDRGNTIAGWVLAALITALGSSILFGTFVFHGETPETGKQGYAIQGVEDTGGGGAAAVTPLPVLLAAADIAKGEAVFKKCTACHVIAPGGAAGVGPALHGVLGKPIGGGAFAYSAALKGKGGNWTFEAMNDWLANPKKFAAGTKMSFAGLGSPEERANVIAYINAQGSNLPLPAVTAEAAAPAAGEPAKDGAKPDDKAGAKPADATAATPTAAAAPAPAAAK